MPLIHVLEQGHLLQLKSLNLTGAVEDCELAACLSAMTQARNFNFESTYFGVQVFPTLVPHFATLETLQWSMCAHVSGEMIQTVLESCPLLRVFCATRVQARLVQQGRPWVCVRMRKLVVLIVVEGQGKDVEYAHWMEDLCEQSRAVFGQIGRVTALEELSIGRE